MSKSIIDKFNEKYCPVPESGCWLWTGAMRGEGNYGAIAIDGKTFGAHRLSYLLHKGEIPEGMQVQHHCDVKECVNPDHLYVGTQKENMADMRRRSRSGYTGSKGESHPSCKITEEIVREIRASSLLQKELCKKYGLRQSQISRIINNQSWRHCE